MASDQQVSARAVLDAELSLRRQGPHQVLHELEQVEPDLTSFLLETLTDIHQAILKLGGPARASQQVYMEVQRFSLVCITALRRGHFELWKQSDAGAQLEDDDDSSSAVTAN